LAVRGVTGVVTRDDVLWFNLCLPTALAARRRHLRYRGRSVESAPASEIGFTGEVLAMKGGDGLEFVQQPCV
jgi:hypothetical protein